LDFEFPHFGGPIKVRTVWIRAREDAQVATQRFEWSAVQVPNDRALEQGSNQRRRQKGDWQRNDGVPSKACGAQALKAV
jgi:hypothetical protein